MSHPNWKRCNDKFDRTSLFLPKKYLELIDQLIEKGIYTSRSEFLRAALRKQLEKEFGFWDYIKAEAEHNLYNKTHIDTVKIVRRLE